MQWNFDANHIDRRHVRICEDVPTGTALITVDGTGDNSIVVVPGANAELSEEDIEGLAREGFGHGDVLVCQLEVPREIVNGALVRGHSLGMTTILNAAPAEDVRDILSAVDVLVVNETEIQPNIGGEFDTREELIERTVALSCDSQTAVVVTLGDEGCIVCDGREVLDIPARRVHVVDTTGAGDTFVGVLSACLAEGMTINKAGQISAAAGSLATTKKGAQSGMPSAEAVYEFMRTH
jgi:ribokinase